MLTSADTIKEGWQKLKLGEILNLNYGKGLPQRHRISGDFPVYGSGGIVGTHNEPLIKAPGIIIGRKGSIGEVYYSNKDFYPIDTVYYIEAQKDNYDLRFIYFLLKNLDLKSLNSDAAVPGLNRTIAHFQDVYLPKSVEKQKKISDFLSAYDDLIEVNQKKIKVLENIAQSIYKEWFVKPTQNGIPGGWKKISLKDSEIFSKSKSRVKKFDGEKLYFDTSCIDRINIIKEPLVVTYNTAPSRAQFIPEYNSVWFARMSNTYKVLVFDNNSDFEVNNYLLSSGMFGIVTEEKYLGYIFALVNSEEFHKQKDSRATGATQVSLTDDGFNTIKFLIPTKKLIEEYSNIVNEYIREILYLQKQNQNLQKTRDLLIPKLVSGKIDLK